MEGQTFGFEPRENMPEDESELRGSEVGWRRLSKIEHSGLRDSLTEQSGWLHEHVSERGKLFTPLKLPQGPSQSRHVPRIRISTFVNQDSETYEVFVDDWKMNSKSSQSVISPKRGWAAFVYDLPPLLKRG